MTRRSSQKAGHRGRPSLESLEDRLTPTTFNVPWADASHLSLSFVPDGTPIAGHASALFQTLNPTGPTSVWQRDILRAFQTWAVNANINIAVTSDGGQALGIAGQTQHDSRFGDIRIGAQAMASDALAVSVPNDPAVAGTMTGDVLINTLDQFAGSGGSLDLFAVMLHESGHVFGLPETTDIRSPMYTSYQGTKKLTDGDIAALQALYGTRSPDRYEGSNGNESNTKATTIPTPGGYEGATPLVVYGDITTTRDVDVYAFRAPSTNYRGAATIRVQSAGLSLLAPRVQILDSKGKTIADEQASSGFGDVITIQIPQLTAGANYFVKVLGAGGDIFSIGSYGVAVSFDARSTATAAQVDAVLRGPYQALNPNDLAALFAPTSSTLVNDDGHSNDEVLNATLLTTTPGYVRDSHYDVVGSLSSSTDTDFYKIRTPSLTNNKTPLVLTVTARAMAVNGAAPRVAVLDSEGLALDVPTQILANGDGTYSIQVVGLRPSGNYLLKVGPDAAAGSAATGNYALTAHYGTNAAVLRSLANDTLDQAGTTRRYSLYVGRSQLLHLLLSAEAVGGVATPGSAARMVIRNANGLILSDLTALAGDTVSGPDVLVTPGAYTVEFTSLGTSGPALNVKVNGGGISDPIGPVLTDPTLAPEYSSTIYPGWFLYPTGILSPYPYLLTPLPIV